MARRDTQPGTVLALILLALVAVALNSYISRAEAQHRADEATLQTVRVEAGL